MNEKVIVSVTGLQVMENEDDKIEVITPGKYYLKNDRHYITYEEIDDDTQEHTKNMVKAYDNCVEVTKKGSMNTKLCFEAGKMSQALYNTMFGELLMEVKTDEVAIEEQENLLNIFVKYELFINNARASVNTIEIKVNNMEAE